MKTSDIKELPYDDWIELRRACHRLRSELQSDPRVREQMWQSAPDFSNPSALGKAWLRLGEMLNKT